MGPEVPIIGGRTTRRHAAILLDNCWDDGRSYPDGGCPPQILLQVCDNRWQAAANYFRLPIDAVECQRCRWSARQSYEYFLKDEKPGISDIFETFSEEKFRQFFMGGKVSQLVLADLLDEMGDSRGEWMRCVIELVERNGKFPSLRRIALLNRALEIKREFDCNRLNAER